MGQSLYDFMAHCNMHTTQSPAAHLVYRWTALAKFRSTSVGLSENMGWLFLYLHQLIYEKVAIAYPGESGMAGMTEQRIQTAVNRDIDALSRAKFGQDQLSKNDKKNNKVGLLYCID